MCCEDVRVFIFHVPPVCVVCVYVCVWGVRCVCMCLRVCIYMVLFVSQGKCPCVLSMRRERVGGGMWMGLGMEEEMCIVHIRGWIWAGIMRIFFIARITCV